MSDPYWSSLSTRDVLEDLASRFLINLPSEEQKSLERICFQVEQAHWFYDDFVRPQNPALPGFHMRTFCQALLRASGLEVEGDLATAYDRFLKYKFAVPVCGAIMLNESLEKVVLVKGYKNNASWTFPRGKINQNESDRDCAVREVWEETGYDLSPHFDSTVTALSNTSKMGPAPLAQDIELDDMISVRTGESELKLFIVPGVPEATTFETRTRREIGKIAWFPISSLASHQSHAGRSGGISGDDQLPGSKFYMVAPAVKPLRAWIKRYRKEHKLAAAAASPMPAHVADQPSYADVEEANKALQALFFGPNHAARAQQEPVPSVPSAAEPGDVRILQREDPARPMPLQEVQQKAPALSPGLLDEAERARAQAAVMSTLLDISKADSPVEPLRSNSELLDALFANVALDAKKLDYSPERRRSELHITYTPEAASRREANPSHSPERHLAGEHLLSSLRLSQSAARTAEPIASGYPLHPPATMLQPAHAYAPATAPALMPVTFPPISMPAYLPMQQPPMNGMPPMHAPSWSLPMPMHQPLPHFVPPSAPVTFSSAGPPLQPTPRRPITLLDNHVPTPPPVMQPTNADALLSLLNVGGFKPLVAGPARL